MHIPEIEFPFHPVNPGSILMEPVITQFILHPKINHQTYSQANRQPKDIDEGV
jgi:hypothetical protein